MSSDAAWYERRFDATYLEAYAHRDASEAERATSALLVPLGLQGRLALDLACGSGRYLRELDRHGARAVGLDLSADLLHAAGQAGIGAALGLVRADMLRLPFRSACFDLVISMFTSFGYFPRPEQDRAMLTGIARVLRPGGDLVLDFLNAVRLEHELVPETQRTSGSFEVCERRRLDAAHRLVVKDIELWRDGVCHRYVEQVRLWSAPELVAVLSQAGLETLQLWGDYSGSAFAAETSDRLVVHAQRRAAP